MRNFGLLVFMVSFLFVLSPFVLAQTSFGPFSYADYSSWLKIALGNPNLPQEWFSGINFIYYIIFPFIAIMTVIYGILTDVRIFRNDKTKWILSFSMAAMTLPTGWLMAFVYFVYTFAASLAVVVFAIVFVFGTVLWGIGKGYSFKGELVDTAKEINDIRRQRKELRGRYIRGDITEEKWREQDAKMAAIQRNLQEREGTAKSEAPGD